MSPVLVIAVALERNSSSSSDSTEEESLSCRRICAALTVCFMGDNSASSEVQGLSE